MLQTLVNSPSNDYFNHALVDIIKSIYKDMNIFLNIVHEFVNDKMHFVKYALDSAEGTCGKISNNPAEQNHSNIIAHFGSGQYDDLAEDAKRHIVCHQNQEIARNQEKNIYS